VMDELTVPESELLIRHRRRTSPLRSGAASVPSPGT
jgi:hypothetical protein